MKYDGIWRRQGKEPNIIPMEWPKVGTTTRRRREECQCQCQLMGGEKQANRQERIGGHFLLFALRICTLPIMYYAAMIFGALEQWEDAVLFLERLPLFSIEKSQKGKDRMPGGGNANSKAILVFR